MMKAREFRFCATHRRIWGVAVLTVLLAILSVTTAAPPPTPVFVGRHDVGVVQLGEAVHHSFILTNAEGTTVKISGVLSLCDCLQAVSQPETIGPHAAGEIAVVITPHRLGAFDSGLQVEIAGESTPRLFMVSGWVDDGTMAESSGLLISAKESMTRTNGSEAAIFIDVRSQDKFRLGHIPRSLNLPPYTVKARSFLRPHRLIVLNEGYDDRTLLRECQGLRRLGFSGVQVLRGGLREWQRTGGALEGEQVRDALLAELTPGQFHQVHSEPGWLILGLAGKDAPLANSALLDPERMDLRFLDYQSSTQTNLKHSLSSMLSKGLSPRRILLMTLAGREHNELEHLLGDFRGPPVFYLKGGMEAYQDYQRRQVAIQNRRQVTVSISGNSATRFNNSSSPGTAGGCCGGKR